MSSLYKVSTVKGNTSLSLFTSLRHPLTLRLRLRSLKRLSATPGSFRPQFLTKVFEIPIGVSVLRRVCLRSRSDSTGLTLRTLVGPQLQRNVLCGILVLTLWEKTMEFDQRSYLHVLAFAWGIESPVAVPSLPSTTTTYHSLAAHHHS